jgi:hypothetical protein
MMRGIKIVPSTLSPRSIARIVFIIAIAAVATILWFQAIWGPQISTFQQRNQSTPDDRITSNLKATLSGNPTTRQLGIQVSVRNGVVTLSGTVPSESSRNEVRSVAMQTNGVARVIDQMVVHVSPVISDVSPILAQRDQNIIIRGHGFGTAPRLLALGGGVVDTVSCNNTDPSLSIVEIGPGIEGWTAGRSTCNDTNTIGIRLVSWSDSKILLSGFGPLLGTRLQPSIYKIVPGDRIEVTVFGSDNSGQYTFPTAVKPIDADAGNVSNGDAVSRRDSIKDEEPTPDRLAEKHVRDILGIWVESFRRRDVRAHMECYAPVVETYFRRHNVPNEQLRQYEEKAFAGIAQIRQYEISEIQILPDSDGRYSATFRKKWDTPTRSGQPFSGEEIQRLKFARFSSGWKIVSEEELRILHVSNQKGPDHEEVYDQSPAFRTNQYELVVGSLRKSGAAVTVSLTIQIVNQAPTVPCFRRDSVVLVDETGERWSLAAATEQGREAACRTMYQHEKQALDLVFRSNGGALGKSFTLYATEMSPTPGRLVRIPNLAAP